MTDFILWFARMVLFGLCVIPVVAVLQLALVLLYRLTVPRLDDEFREYWSRHRLRFEAVYMVVPFVLSGVFGYFFFVLLCVNILLPSVIQMRAAAATAMVAILGMATYQLRKMRLREFSPEQPAQPPGGAR